MNNDDDDFLWIAALNSDNCRVNDTNWLVPTDFESANFESISHTVNLDHNDGLLIFYFFVFLH